MKASFDAEAEIYNKLELLDNDLIPDVTTLYKKVLLEWTNNIALDPVILTMSHEPTMSQPGRSMHLCRETSCTRIHSFLPCIKMLTN